MVVQLFFMSDEYLKNNIEYLNMMFEVSTITNQTDSVYELLKKVKDIGFKKAYVDAKRRAYKAGLNKWLKIDQPRQLIL